MLFEALSLMVIPGKPPLMGICGFVLAVGGWLWLVAASETNTLGVTRRIGAKYDEVVRGALHGNL